MSLADRIAAIAASDQPLQAKLDALRIEHETDFATSESVDSLHRSVAELMATGAASRVLKAGDLAPEFSLPDTDGRLVSSRELLVHGPLVISFFRGGWCPYCGLDLLALEAARLEIESRGASMLAISQQTRPFGRKARRRNALGFPLLTDQGGAVSAQFGVRWTVQEYVREIHRTAGANIPVFNGDESWSLAMPSRFLIGSDGVIVYAETSPDYTRRSEPSDMFVVLDALRRHDSPARPRCGLVS